ncbi:hypothetical protein NXS15_02485 [Mycoplasma sp. CSL7475-4]|uniref:hypothetical protein n=1 Tax=Mycoplasma sp. CSL7475-4 TaxID=2973942 RepID=UPI00216AEEBB|nr:hypothetical protein [Mycoplasma sp. CSL7475-4]MCS4536980.1 hypothetical protein [Mycoplasma sp. CSL7475-4]
MLFLENKKGFDKLQILTATNDNGMQKRLSGVNYLKNESIKKFNLVNRFDFVLHLSSYFAGLAFSELNGLTSPAYSVLRLKDMNEYNPYFLKIIFKSKDFIQKLKPITFGLRMGKSIKVEDLVKIIIVKPKVDEQTKICKLINNADYVISLLQCKPKTC